MRTRGLDEGNGWKEGRMVPFDVYFDGKRSFGRELCRGVMQCSDVLCHGYKFVVFVVF